MLLKIIAILLCILSVLVILPAAADPVAVVFLLAIMVVAGMTALSGTLKYALFVFSISTLFIVFYTLSLLSWFPFLSGNEPLPEGITKIEDLPPIPRFDKEQMARDISKQSGIPYEELINAEVVEASSNSTKASEVFHFLKFVSLPYLFTLLLIWFGWYIKKTKE